MSKRSTAVLFLGFRVVNAHVILLTLFSAQEVFYIFSRLTISKQFKWYLTLAFCFCQLGWDLKVFIRSFNANVKRANWVKATIDFAKTTHLGLTYFLLKGHKILYFLTSAICPSFYKETFTHSFKVFAIIAEFVTVLENTTLLSFVCETLRAGWSNLRIC